jgi:hypothetical protein
VAKSSKTVAHFSKKEKASEQKKGLKKRLIQSCPFSDMHPMDSLPCFLGPHLLTKKAYSLRARDGYIAPIHRHSHILGIAGRSAMPVRFRTTS